MGFKKEEVIEAAKQDLSRRLEVDGADIEEVSVTDREFPDMALGAPTDDEMAAQMISSGWEIMLGVNDETYEYRADKYHVRLVNFNGQNYVLE